MEILELNKLGSYQIDSKITEENTKTSELRHGFGLIIELTSAKIQEIISYEMIINNAPIGTTARLSVYSEDNILLAQTSEKYRYYNGMGQSIKYGLNTFEFSQGPIFPEKYVYKMRLQTTNKVDILGDTVDLKDGRKKRFVPYLKAVYIGEELSKKRTKVGDESWFDFMDRAKLNGVSPTMQEEIDRR